ncbi:MAG: replicative DNA helicase [Holophagaceae bacterium]|nr:replicative DNA helicase [Holophagaceae bacterium]
MSQDWIPEHLPEDLDAERSLIATCCAPGMEQEAAEAVFALTEDDFVHPAHKAIFRAMCRLVEAGLPINALTLKDTLANAKDLSRVGDFAGIVEILIAEEVQNPQVLSDILIRKRKHRDLIRLGAQLTRKAATEEEPPQVLVEQVSQELFRIAQGQDARGLEPISKVMDDAYQNLLGRLQKGGSSGVRVGFSRLDNVTQGFQPGNLVVLAARPGIGKTALALNWLLHASVRYHRHVAFFSLEMSREEVSNRLISTHTQIDLRSVSHGQLSDEEHQQILSGKNELGQHHIYICDRAAITVREITAMVDKLCTQSNQKLDLVIIDYLQLISSPQDSRAARQTEAVRIGEISRALKILAKERNIPVVVLSQLNREVEHRQGGRPQLSDLRDSGAIEQDADIVMFIHRKARPVMDHEEQDKNAELIISKHRNGPTTVIPLWFEPQLTLYRELERQPEPEID